MRRLLASLPIVVLQVAGLAQPNVVSGGVPIAITHLIVSDAESRSVWDGVYTETQARRGQSTYEQECVTCHSLDLRGFETAPALVGGDFMKYWDLRTVGDLFESMRTTMPADSPGRLSRSQYADLVAYLLSANTFPPGTTELSPDTGALEQITWESSPKR